jgi:hypothetical protein
MEYLPAIQLLSDNDLDRVTGGGSAVVVPRINVNINTNISTIVVGVIVAESSGHGTTTVGIIGIGGNTTTNFHF